MNLINILLALFRVKFACILGISNPVFRWESCKVSVWESVNKCSRLCKETGTRDWISQVARGLQVARSCTRAKHVKSWSVMPAGALQDKKYRLTVQLPRGWNSQLSQAASLSCQLTLFWKTWLFTFHFHPSINTPHTHKSKRILREKP